MIFINERNPMCIAIMETLEKTEGFYVPKTLEDFLMIYGNIHSDENEVRKRARDTDGDGSDALHWGVPMYADSWLRSKALVEKHLKVNLTDTDFPWQKQLIDDAQGIEDRNILQRRKASDDLIPKKEPDSEVERWKALVPERFSEASMNDYPPSVFPYFKHIFSGGSMLMLGPTGVGKTHFLWAAARSIVVEERLDPKEVKVISMQELLAKVRSSGGDWVEEVNARYGSVVWLFVDECDKVMGNESDYLIINSLVNTRYEKRICTVFSGNGTREQLARKLGEPVISRLTAGNEKGMLFLIEGKDRRTTRNGKN